MLQSRASNYIRLYLKLQRINTKAAWLLPTLTITVLLAPYAALPYLLVSLSELTGGFRYFYIFLRSLQYTQTKALGSGDQLGGPYGVRITELGDGAGLFAQQPHPFCKCARVGSGKVLFWVVCVACCQARTREVRFPVVFGAPQWPQSGPKGQELGGWDRTGCVSPGAVGRLGTLV